MLPYQEKMDKHVFGFQTVAPLVVLSVMGKLGDLFQINHNLQKRWMYVAKDTKQLYAILNCVPSIPEQNVEQMTIIITTVRGGLLVVLLFWILVEWQVELQ